MRHPVVFREHRFRSERKHSSWIVAPAWGTRQWPSLRTQFGFAHSPHVFG